MEKRKEIELWRYRHVLIMSFGPPFVTVYFSYRGVPRLFPFVSLTGAYWREIQYQRPFKKRPLSVNFLILTKAFLGFFRLWILVEHIEGWYNKGAFKRPLLLLIFLYYQRRSLLGFFRLQSLVKHIEGRYNIGAFRRPSGALKVWNVSGVQRHLSGTFEI